MTARAKNFVGGMLVGAGLAYSLGRKRRGKQDIAAPMAEPRRYGSRAGDIAGLEAATLEAGHRGMPPAAVVLRLLGGMLVLHGLVRRGRLGRMTRTIGLGLLTRRGLPARLPVRPMARHDRRRVVDIQKTLYIDAPVDQVYAFWNNYENFPLFMSNVREVVDLGGGRSHWSVRGPGGAPIRWDARLTEQVPNQVIAWRSEPGAMLDNAGAIRFQPEGAGTRTRSPVLLSSPGQRGRAGRGRTARRRPTRQVERRPRPPQGAAGGDGKERELWPRIWVVNSPQCRTTSAESSP